MPRQRLQLQFVHINGHQPLFAAPTADGFLLSNDGSTIVIVQTGSSPTTLTIQTPDAYGGGNVIADRTISIGANQTIWVGNLSPGLYNQPDASPDAGSVYLDFAGLTGVLVGAVHIGFPADDLPGRSIAVVPTYLLDFSGAGQSQYVPLLGM